MSLDEYRLAVDATPSTQSPKPGDDVTFSITVKDFLSKPVGGAEVTLAVVDGMPCIIVIVMSLFITVICC